MIGKVFSLLTKDKQPASALEHHNAICREKLKDACVPCQEPEHVVALNNVLAETEFSISMVL